MFVYKFCLKAVGKLIEDICIIYLIHLYLDKNYLKGFLGGENEIMHIRCLITCLEHSRHSINVPYKKVGSICYSINSPYYSFDEEFRYHVSNTLYSINIYFT